jgi:hypothetical protein
MNPHDRVRLRHIVEALNSALKFARGRERKDLLSDEMLLFALVRAVEIAGEAASKVTVETRAKLDRAALGLDDSDAKPGSPRIFRYQSRYSLDHGHRSSPSIGRAPKQRTRKKVELLGADSIAVSGRAITFASRSSSSVVRS